MTQKYKYALSPTTQFYFCGVPFRLDITPKCSLNCSYCFAMSRGGRRTRANLMSHASMIARKLELAIDKRSATDVSSELLRRRMPIHFGGLSDPFANAATTRVAKDMLRHLVEYNYPVVLSTKNPMPLVRNRDFEFLKGYRRIIIQVSFSSPDARLTKCIEARAPLPAQRLRFISALVHEGFFCVARLQPLLMTERKRCVEELIPMLGHAGCRHVIVEFLKLPVERSISRIDTMLRQLRWDAYEDYRKLDARLVGREWLLPAGVKWNALQPVIAAIRKEGMSYGAADYGLHHLGDTACCCGVDLVPGFSNWLHGNLSNIIRMSILRRMRIHAMDRYWYPQASIKRRLNSNCRFQDGEQNMKQYLKARWNLMGRPNAPTEYLGVEWTGECDRSGNRIYHVNAPS